jgi:prophage regulatory protein
MGAAEIAEAFGGISRQRVQQIINRPDFPKPEGELRMGKFWLTEHVTAWAAAHGRQLREIPD